MGAAIFVLVLLDLVWITSPYPVRYVTGMCEIRRYVKCYLKMQITSLF